MQILVYILFLTVFFADFTQQGVNIPKALRLMPEVISLAGTLVVVALLAKNKILSLNAKYFIFFLIFAVHLLNGIIINGTPSGAIVGGLRIYLKYIPFFLLPLVYEFSDDEIKRQMKFLLVLCVFQLPVALIQKLLIASNESGDWIRGTFATSSILSIVLISAIALLFTLYLRKQVKFFHFILFLILLILPALINETKGTLVLLPIAVFLPLIFDGHRRVEKRQMFPIALVLIFLFGGYVTVYDAFWGDRYEKQGGSVVDFFTSDRLIRYLAPRSAGYVEEDREGGPKGRIDRILISFERLEKDSVLLIGGLGLGNVTPTPVKFLSGDYEEYEEEGLVSTSFAYLLLETGLVGVILSYLFLYMVFRDALWLSKREDLAGAIGLGWMSIVCIIGVTFLYKDTIMQNVLMYLFWFYSGYLIAYRFRTRRENNAHVQIEPEALPATNIGRSFGDQKANIVRQDSRTKWLITRR